MKSLKAQIFSYDLVFALMAVAFLLWYSINAANAFADKVGQVEAGNKMAEVAQSALAQLTESPGDPSDWGTLEANSLGISESRGVIDRGKVEKLTAIVADSDGYEKVRAMLSMNRQGGAFLFNLRVEEVDGRGLYSLGPKDPEEASVASVSKVMVMDGRLVRISMRTWDIADGVGG